MILYLSDKGRTDEEIHEIPDVSTRTIERTRQKYVTRGLDSVLFELPHPGQPKTQFETIESQQVLPNMFGITLLSFQ